MTQKVCLVTGGGRGIGAAVAREMHARGYSLVLMSPSESCEALAAELGGVAHRGVAQSADDLKAVVDLAMATHGRIDAVLKRKQHLFDEHVDRVTIDPSRLFGEKEIFGLFGLEPPRRTTAMQEGA